MCRYRGTVFTTQTPRRWIAFVRSTRKKNSNSILKGKEFEPGLNPGSNPSPPDLSEVKRIVEGSQLTLPSSPLGTASLFSSHLNSPCHLVGGRYGQRKTEIVKNPRCQARHQGYNQANSHKSKPSKQAQTLGQLFCFGLQHSHQCSSLEPKWKTYHSSPTCQLGLKDLQNYPQVTKLDESGSL